MSGAIKITDIITPEEARRQRAALIANARPVTTFSVYEMMERLRELNVYAEAKDLLMQIDMWDRLILLKELRSDNPYFIKHFPMIEEAILQMCPQADIDAELEKCIIKKE